MNTFRIALIGLALFGLFGCQTAPPASDTALPPAPATPEVPDEVLKPASSPDSITSTSGGFSPLAMSPANSIDLELRWGAPDSVTGWVVAVVNESEAVLRTIEGTTAVTSLSWNGRDEDGNPVPQGNYQAVLRRPDAEGETREVARSGPFLVDVEPPTGTIEASPNPILLEPTGTLVNLTSHITIRLDLQNGGAHWTTWRLRVMHPDGRMFRDFISEEHRQNVVQWDGRSLSNARLETGIMYRLEAEVLDEYGNRGLITGVLSVLEAPAIAETPAELQVTPVIVRLDGNALAELPIYFPPFSPDLNEVSDSKLRETNKESLDKLAQLLMDAAGSSIVLLGHANHVFYQDTAKAELEQALTLVPLSEARAKNVLHALVGLGVPGDIMIARGVGGDDPVVPFSDVSQRWKNRRVVVEVTSP